MAGAGHGSCGRGARDGAVAQSRSMAMDVARTVPHERGLAKSLDRDLIEMAGGRDMLSGLLGQDRAGVKSGHRWTTRHAPAFTRSLAKKSPNIIRVSRFR